MAVITLWHNPRCSKSRQALQLIEEAGVPVTIRRYLENPPETEELEKIRTALGLTTVHDMMRKNEAAYKALGLSAATQEAGLLAAMVTHPILIERPIVMLGGRAVIGRPPEAVKTLLKPL